MTARQFRAALLTLGIHSHMRAADVLGVGRRSIIRYAHDRAMVPDCLERLIRMMMKHGIPPEYANKPGAK